VRVKRFPTGADWFVFDRSRSTLAAGDGQPLPGCRKLFLAFLEFRLQCGELVGVLVQLLPRLRKLRILTVNCLILRLKLLRAGLRCQR
jgi:hypothetical protein